jgi:threonine synthase
MSYPAESKAAAPTESRLRCVGCDAAPQRPEPDFRCKDCGELLELYYPGWNESEGKRRFAPVALQQQWQERKLSLMRCDQSGVWRFRDLLPPIPEEYVITLGEGNTPVYELPRCARAAGVERLLAKHQGMNPTASFKDTGMTVAISAAQQEHFRWVACASTGNTSASMAAYASRAGMRSLVLIPEGHIAWGKLSQSLDYGALTCQLRTDFDGCLHALSALVKRYPAYMMNSLNPYRIEGQKTAAIELLEQLGWEVPEHVIVPGGNLGNSSALGKAFGELRALGVIPRLPKLSIIQAEGANALVRTWRETGGQRLVPVQAETMATAIRIGNPASWRKAVRILQESGGACEQVSEAEIAVAKAEIGSDGVGCEPASAVTLAGLKKLVRSRFVKPNESVVLILTGHVLKDPEYTIKFHRGDLLAGTKEQNAFSPHRRAPVVLDPDLDGILRLLESWDQSQA